MIWLAEGLYGLICGAFLLFMVVVVRILAFILYPLWLYLALASFREAGREERQGNFREAAWKYAEAAQTDFIVEHYAKKRLRELLQAHGPLQFDDFFISRMTGIPVGRLGDPGTESSMRPEKLIKEVARQEATRTYSQRD